MKASFPINSDAKSEFHNFEQIDDFQTFSAFFHIKIREESSVTSGFVDSREKKTTKSLEKNQRTTFTKLLCVFVYHCGNQNAVIG